MPVFRVCSLILSQVGGGPCDPAHLATDELGGWPIRFAVLRMWNL